MLLWWITTLACQVLGIFVVNQRWCSSRDPNVTPTTTTITVGDVRVAESRELRVCYKHQLRGASDRIKQKKTSKAWCQSGKMIQITFENVYGHILNVNFLPFNPQNRVEKLLKLRKRYKKDTFSEDSVWHYFLTAFIGPSLNLLNLQSTFFFCCLAPFPFPISFSAALNPSFLFQALPITPPFTPPALSSSLSCSCICVISLFPFSVQSGVATWSINQTCSVWIAELSQRCPPSLALANPLNPSWGVQKIGCTGSINLLKTPNWFCYLLLSCYYVDPPPPLI